MAGIKVGCPICAVGNLDSTASGQPIITRRCEHMKAEGRGIPHPAEQRASPFSWKARLIVTLRSYLDLHDREQFNHDELTQGFAFKPDALHPCSCPRCAEARALLGEEPGDALSPADRAMVTAVRNDLANDLAAGLACRDEAADVADLLRILDTVAPAPGGARTKKNKED